VPQPSPSARSFLERCPQEVAEIFRYWEEKCGNRAMPRRADIAPEDFVRQLPGILLVDVEGLDASGVGIYRYRVVGTAEVTLRGHDPTGKRIEEGFWGPTLEDVIDSYEFVRKNRTFLYDPNAYVTPEGRLSKESTIFLPLSEDGISVTQVLVYSISHERDVGV